jgi:hypothetical protein
MIGPNESYSRWNQEHAPFIFDHLTFCIFSAFCSLLALVYGMDYLAACDAMQPFRDPCMSEASDNLGSQATEQIHAEMQDFVNVHLESASIAQPCLKKNIPQVQSVNVHLAFLLHVELIYY